MLCLLYVMIIIKYGGISGEARWAAFLILDIMVVSVECFGGSLEARYLYSPRWCSKVFVRIKFLDDCRMVIFFASSRWHDVYLIGCRLL